ncbi:MAG TPA: hypothetical protein VHZ25_00590 [Acidobacteriaceae bacterium]|jgi:hypothetical protein|nr:hypothetical protein [Acidobacteriaceae bacterium]
MALRSVYADMRIRLHRPFSLGAGFLSASLIFALNINPQTGNQRKPPEPPAHYTTQGALPMPEDRADDSYAIYALLMPGQTLASLPSAQGAPWAIGSITVNDADRNPAVPPQGQLKPPPENSRGFEEAVQDYQVNRYYRIALTRSAFQLDHAFALLRPEEVDALKSSKTAPQVSSETQSQWSGYAGVTFFSEVYFDTKHRAALVYENDWCAQLCAAGTWIYLEKHGDQWVRRSGIVTGGA